MSDTPFWEDLLFKGPNKNESPFFPSAIPIMEDLVHVFESLVHFV